MPNIHNVKHRAAQASIKRLGRTVLINGVEHQAIYADDEFEDEAGIRRILELTVLKTVAQKLSRGDVVHVNGVDNKIRRIPDLDDELITMELQRAT